MLYGYIIALVLSILVPIAITIFILRKIKPNIWLLTAGILMYIASMLLLLVLTNILGGILNVSDTTANSTWFMIISAIVSAVLIVICQEAARWFGFRLLKKNSESWQSAMTLGLGFGAISSIGMSAITAINFYYFLVITSPGMLEGLSLTPEEKQTYEIQKNLLTATPWYTPLPDALTYLLTFFLQVLFTFMMWKAVTKRSWQWLVGLLGAHFAFEQAVNISKQLGFGTWLIVLVYVFCTAVLGFVLYQFIFKQLIRDAETARAAARKDV